MRILSITMFCVLGLGLAPAGGAFAGGETAPASVAAPFPVYRNYVTIYGGALMNLADAQFYLGEACLDGEGLPQNTVEGLHWLEKAAAQDHPGALLRLGTLYLNGGPGVAADPVRGEALIRKSANFGYGLAQNQLGRMYAEGNHLPQDDVQSYMWLDLATRSAGAAVNGEAFAEDRDTVASSMKRSRIAEAKKLAAAWKPTEPSLGRQAEIGYRLVLQGRYDEALVVLTPLAEGGEPLAQLGLGSIYTDGKRAQSDPAAAAVWYRNAADQGHPMAQLNLGLAYQKGLGVPQDFGLAARYLQASADQGFGSGQLHFGLAVADGEGVIKDEARAVQYFEQAADQGFADAMFVLAVHRFTGKGGKEDWAEAYKWIRLAVVYGDNPAYGQTLETIAGTIGADRVAQGEQRARQWKPVFARY